MTPLFAFDQLPTLMFLVGCALLTTILLRRWSRYFGRGRRGRTQQLEPLEKQPRPTGQWSGMQRDSQAQSNRQQVELHDMARDIGGQLNSKIILLEQLIATSQQQIERMESLLDKAEKKSHADSVE